MLPSLVQRGLGTNPQYARLHQTPYKGESMAMYTCNLSSVGVMVVVEVKPIHRRQVSRTGESAGLVKKSRSQTSKGK